MSESRNFPPCRVNSVAELPVHALCRPPHWPFCSEPERPLDHMTAIDWRCPRCLMKVAVELLVRGDSWQQGLNPDGSFANKFSLSNALSNAQRHLAGECEHGHAWNIN